MTDDKDKPPHIVVQTVPGPLAAGVQGAVETITSLKAAPVFMLVLLLNAVFVGSMTYLLLEQERYRHEERLRNVGLFEKCFGVGDGIGAGGSFKDK